MKERDDQLSLGELIDELKKHDRAHSVVFDFGNCVPSLDVHSYRGFYRDLGIGYADEGRCTVAELIGKLEWAIDEGFDGYNGGWYVMSRETAVWASRTSRDYTQTAIIGVTADRFDPVVVIQTGRTEV